MKSANGMAGPSEVLRASGAAGGLCGGDGGGAGGWRWVLVKKMEFCGPLSTSKPAFSLVYS